MISVSLLVALTGLLSAIAGIAGLFVKVKAVHSLVNSQLDRMITRVEQLTGVLQGANIDVPHELGKRLPLPPAPGAPPPPPPG
jgi:hypothetical protein